ncbi:uncharacterized protein LAESUDRAFT_710692 [Laetiporus sulphureus 93-53]|uniref:Uncharacterized protein n=1 Tax=Laetiporus sulphureus 93-53 TaxID=1314785 RepID=A0A165HWF5_9APHY|nr:uncharacterized protein LAESUDRAFT_710692 [Laetiporus sulphureus 93-53]KZT12280.1 hypothetical protein LAESUDRAFT_710692 [Laetiporus sulphureus 93-53]
MLDSSVDGRVFQPQTPQNRRIATSKGRLYLGSYPLYPQNHAIPEESLAPILPTQKRAAPDDISTETPKHARFEDHLLLINDILTPPLARLSAKERDAPSSQMGWGPSELEVGDTDPNAAVTTKPARKKGRKAIVLKSLAQELVIQLFQSPKQWTPVKDVIFRCLPSGDLDLRTLVMHLGINGPVRSLIQQISNHFTTIKMGSWTMMT